MVDEKAYKTVCNIRLPEGFSSKKVEGGGLFFNTNTHTITFASDTTTHKIKFSFNTTTYTIKKTAIPKQQFMLVLCNEQANLKARLCFQWLKIDKILYPNVSMPFLTLFKETLYINIKNYKSFFLSNYELYHYEKYWFLVLKQNFYINIITVNILSFLHLSSSQATVTDSAELPPILAKPGRGSYILDVVCDDGVC